MFPVRQSRTRRCCPEQIILKHTSNYIIKITQAHIRKCISNYTKAFLSVEIQHKLFYGVFHKALK